MLVADSRSGVQVAAAEGSTKKADLRLGAGLFGGGGGAAGGGYGNTNEGKIIAAAFMDNYNKIVGVVRNDPSLQRNVGTLKEEAAAGGTTQGRRRLQRGRRAVAEDRGRQAAGAADATRAKCWRRSAAATNSWSIGEEKDGYINVQGATGSGWVKIVLVQKR